jgi:methyl-accepting chemotaxis protein
LSFVTEAPDGRAISVVNRPIPGSKYWVGTHDDITERRSAERRSALLGEQEARRAVVDEAIAWFRESVEGVLQTVADSVAAMKSTATVLSATSNETTAQTAGAVATSNEAFGSVEVAATAADELATSIAEINSQLGPRHRGGESRGHRGAIDQRDIAGLARAAQKIDDVVKLIQAWPDRPICWRSTPPSRRRARARPARASPLSLPRSRRSPCRPAKATDDIAAQIAAVQSSTQSAVGAIGNVTGRMHDIRQFTAAIATSVEQQNAATKEISYSVAAAASGTKSVVAVLQRVSGAIADMHSSADTVLAASQAVEEGGRQPARQRRRLSPQSRDVG